MTTAKRLTNGNPILLVALLSAAVLAVTLTAYAFTSSGKSGDVHATAFDDFGTRPPPPRSVAELVEASELVVVGRIVGIVDVDKVYPTGYDPESEPTRPGVDLGVAFSNLRVEVSEYLLGDGPSSLLLRQFGDVRDPDLPWARLTPTQSDEVILFLRPVEGQREDLANLHWPVKGWWGEMVVSGDAVRFVDGAGDTFLDALTATAVKEAVRETAAANE